MYGPLFDWAAAMMPRSDKGRLEPLPFPVVIVIAAVVVAAIVASIVLGWL